ncbi:hypothetical protein [Coleofasciculus sp.]|uniref:hypothetical protein n=1 Tax=Coleofasciculus sp. TaxID=3100458 RepID=UPI0039F76925
MIGRIGKKDEINLAAFNLLGIFPGSPSRVLNSTSSTVPESRKRHRARIRDWEDIYTRISSVISPINSIRFSAF